MTIRDFQDFIRQRYYARDSQRGTPHTFMWFVEEVGELSSALAGDKDHDKEEEFADVMACDALIALMRCSPCLMMPPLQRKRAATRAAALGCCCALGYYASCSHLTGLVPASSKLPSVRRKAINAIWSRSAYRSSSRANRISATSRMMYFE